MLNERQKITKGTDFSLRRSPFYQQMVSKGKRKTNVYNQYIPKAQRDPDYYKKIFNEYRHTEDIQTVVQDIVKDSIQDLMKSERNLSILKRSVSHQHDSGTKYGINLSDTSQTDEDLKD